MIQSVPRADACDHEAGEFARFIGVQRNQHGRIWRIARRPGREAAESASETVDNDHFLTLQQIGNRPRCGRRVEWYLQWTRGFSRRNSRRSGESRRIAFGVDQIKQRKRNILGVIGEHRRGDRACVLRRLRVRCARAEIAQDNDTPFPDDLFGDLVNGREHAADAAHGGLVGHRTISDGEMRLFEKAVAIYVQLDVFHPRRRAAFKWRIDERLENSPDFGPYVADGLA
ncbi:MAG: hypothetical protein WAV27_26830 [Xanthobacteraceae bacterium]